MKRAPLSIASGLAALLAAVPFGIVQAHDNSLYARAIVQGPGGVQGVVVFVQKACVDACAGPQTGVPATDPAFRNFPVAPVEVLARISGPPGSPLTPGAHGMHIHEAADCSSAGFTSAGGHFDAGPYGHSNPVDLNHPFHSGDLPNLIVNARGIGKLKHTTSRITLSPGPLSIFDFNGSAVIVHLNPDRGETGITGASGGPRIACGIVEPASANDVDGVED